MTARKKAGAEIYYRRALDQLAGTPKRTEASYLAEARIRARIKDPAGVTAVFDKLLKEHPAGPGLRAEYADLPDQGRTTRSRPDCPEGGHLT